MQYPPEALAAAKNVLDNGTDEERLAFFAFKPTDSIETIVFKFEVWTRAMYPRYFQSPSAPFHRLMAEYMIRAYCGLPITEKGELHYLNLGFRGCAKTTLTKLFLAFAILNDETMSRKYMKVLTRNQGNARQIVTDVYNLMLEVEELYGDYFLKDNKNKKQEETMGSFTTNDGRKLLSGTIGMTQRGHLQDASRPDFILFDDVEDRESINSLPQTESTIFRIDEALSGLSADGRFVCNGNYISEEGVIQWFINMKGTLVHKIPIMADGKPTWGERYDEKWIEEKKPDAEDWFGEYMCDPTRADATFFDRARVDADMEKSEQPHLESAGVKYYGEYQPHHAFAIGADVGEGVGRDSHTMVGWDFGTMTGEPAKVVLTYANNTLAPDLFGHEFMRVGREFGNCLLCPERNNSGHGVIAVMRGYPNIFTQRSDDTKRRVSVTEKFGWTTNKKTKPMMFFEFRKAYNDGLIIITDLNLLKEMRAYTTMDLQETRVGLITRHFDLLTAAVIGYQMHKYVSLDYTELEDLPEDEEIYSDIFS